MHVKAFILLKTKRK